LARDALRKGAAMLNANVVKAEQEQKKLEAKYSDCLSGEKIWLMFFIALILGSLTSFIVLALFGAPIDAAQCYTDTEVELYVTLLCLRMSYLISLYFFPPILLFWLQKKFYQHRLKEIREKIR
jgi:glucan phosphoethanolaminetransferase (alkaline phosphatase superfamily)